MVEEAVGCQMGLGKCYSRFLKDFFPSFRSDPLLFPAMPPLFATHPTSGNPTFRNNKPENEPGHVLTKLNRGQSELLFLFTFENLLFESNQTRGRQHLNQSVTTVEKSPHQWPWKRREDPEDEVDALDEVDEENEVDEEDLVDEVDEADEVGDVDEVDEEDPVDEVDGTPGRPVLICSSLD